ncbi:MAG: ABC transporter ATP-binding protein [Planctomycetales bacterium]|nr:ABC transporter ATP-binding protein [Planctomycetales bacterium]
MIEVQNLCIRYPGFQLQDVSFQVQKGEFAVLMGRTGCGKTSVLESICGLRKVQSGSIRLGGREVTRLRPSERGIGYVPQDAALFPTMTIFDHLAFALEIRKWKSVQIKERVHEIAELLEIEHLLQRQPQGLSGGEGQRVALGRAISFHPKFLLLDEPLSALDETTRQTLYDVIRRVQSVARFTALHITHSRSEAKILGDRIFRLHQKKIHDVTDESPDSLSASAEVSE